MRCATSGYSFLELLCTLALLSVLAAATNGLRRRGPGAERCTELLGAVLSDAHLRASLSRTERRIAFRSDTAIETMSPDTSRTLFLLPDGCRVSACAFGSGERRATEAAFFSTGTASPGRVTVTGRDGSCLLTLALYGSVRQICHTASIE